MRDRLLFLTGRMAAPRLERTLAALGETAFDWSVRDIGVKVAALMSEDIVRRRLGTLVDADRVILPGRCSIDPDRLGTALGVPVVKGPEELKDLPRYLGRAGRPPDLSRHACRIFAEIVDASAWTVPAILAKAREMAAAGADVIDLGCRPDTPFDHLEDAIAALKQEGFAVSVDSGSPDDLLRGGRAGADYLLSLTEETLWVVDEVAATPVLIPAAHGDLDSLLRAIDAMAARNRPCLADPILDPIHFGFTASLERYAALRRARPDAAILMGTGNLTELTDADTTGITAVLMGIVSELDIAGVLIVQVSPHTRRTVQEHDLARRIMHAAKTDSELPRNYHDGLLALHARRPFPNTPDEIAASATEVRDRNYRIEAAADGLHIYNKHGHHRGTDPFALYPNLGVADDASHAFYLGVELARAEVAWMLGKRYAQDGPLDWGVAADPPADDPVRLERAHGLRKTED